MNNMSIFAQSLSTIANTKGIRLNGNLCGSPADFLKLKNAISAIRLPAYSVYAQRFDNANNGEVVKVDMSALYDATKALCALIGDVNGAPIHAENVVELMISQSFRVRTIDITKDMAHAHAMKKAAQEEYDENPTEENELALENWKATCKTLETTPGNCRDLRESVSESAFVTKVARLLGAIIDEQKAKSVEQVMAEEAARKAELKARAKARKAMKK